ncbi:hypothetical protein BD413DRAFT_161419 [Trametes elegans]|nr:hypothetical protein BD413DRAFT_161419 [Trametes elegans]
MMRLRHGLLPLQDQMQDRPRPRPRPRCSLRTFSPPLPSFRQSPPPPGFLLAFPRRSPSATVATDAHRRPPCTASLAAALDCHGICTELDMACTDRTHASRALHHTIHAFPNPSPSPIPLALPASRLGPPAVSEQDPPAHTSIVRARASCLFTGIPTSLLPFSATRASPGIFQPSLCVPYRPSAINVLLADPAHRSRSCLSPESYLVPRASDEWRPAS